MHRKPRERAVAEFTQAVGLFVRRVRAAAAHQELSLTESAVLARLQRHGPATTAELARAESIKPQSMGATVAALEAQNLVQRRPHPTDGRQVHIELTKQGAALRESVRSAKHLWLAKVLGQLTQEEQDTLFKAGEILQRLAEQDIAP